MNRENIVIASAPFPMNDGYIGYKGVAEMMIQCADDRDDLCKRLKLPPLGSDNFYPREVTLDMLRRAKIWDALLDHERERFLTKQFANAVVYLDNCRRCFKLAGIENPFGDVKV